MTTNTSGLNLTAHRAAASIWDRRGWDGSAEIAVSRWLIGVAGTVLAIQGIRQRSATGSMLAGLGGGLAWWALTGRADVSGARRWFASVFDRFESRRADLVQDASADSFPASDAPARTATVGTGVRHHARHR